MRIGRAAAAPLRRYLDYRFDRLEERLASFEDGARERRASSEDGAHPASNDLSRVDLTEHNTGMTPPDFDHVVSQAVSAAQFAHPAFDRLCRIVYPTNVNLPWGEAPAGRPHRKVWEYVYVLRAAEQHGLLRNGLRAIGFGVGHDPIPAVLAAQGLSVLATDRDAAEGDSGTWAATGQHLSSLRAISMPEIVPADVLERQVTIRYVDMNEVPDDLGTFDLVWSCCALEHLGSPRAGLDFVLRTLDLLRPGGVSVHTTELELTPRSDTADYGHLAVYRIVDLDELAREVRRRGFVMETNWYVSMETAADRWIGRHPYDDPAHLKLVVGESLSTSVGLLIRRPSSAAIS
jgi:hypothetical protein